MNATRLFNWQRPDSFVVHASNSFCVMWSNGNNNCYDNRAKTKAAVTGITAIIVIRNKYIQQYKDQNCEGKQCQSSSSYLLNKIHVYLNGCVSVSEWMSSHTHTHAYWFTSFTHLQIFVVVFLFVFYAPWLVSLCSCLSPQCQHVDMWDVTSDSEVAWWELFSASYLHNVVVYTSLARWLADWLAGLLAHTALVVSGVCLRLPLSHERIVSRDNNGNIISNTAAATYQVAST